MVITCFTTVSLFLTAVASVANTVIVATEPKKRNLLMPAGRACPALIST